MPKSKGAKASMVGTTCLQQHDEEVYAGKVEVFVEKKNFEMT